MPGQKRLKNRAAGGFKHFFIPWFPVAAGRPRRQIAKSRLFFDVAVVLPEELGCSESEPHAPDNGMICVLVSTFGDKVVDEGVTIRRDAISLYPDAS